MDSGVDGFDGIFLVFSYLACWVPGLLRCRGCCEMKSTLLSIVRNIGGSSQRRNVFGIKICISFF